MMYQFDNLYEENEPEITNKDIKKGVKPNMITISKITTSNIDDKKGSMGGGDNINTTTFDPISILTKLNPPKVNYNENSQAISMIKTTKSPFTTSELSNTILSPSMINIELSPETFKPRSI